VDAMNIEMASQAEADEEILTFDIPDAVLERAGTAEQTAFTLFYCTNQSSECGAGLVFWRNSSGSLAIFTAIRRASSFVRRMVGVGRCDS
jgi:hypothetical protein